MGIGICMDVDDLDMAKEVHLFIKARRKLLAALSGEPSRHINKNKISIHVLNVYDDKVAFVPLFVPTIGVFREYCNGNVDQRLKLSMVEYFLTVCNSEIHSFRNNRLELSCIDSAKNALLVSTESFLAIDCIIETYNTAVEMNKQE